MSRSKTLNKSSGQRIIVLTAPSGSGKTSVARRLLESLPELRFSVSATTRPARPTEEDGVDYHFMTAEAFEEARLAGQLLEYQEVYPGCLYGTLVGEVERSSAKRPVVLDIDVKGAANVKRQFGDRAFVIFIRPPSIVELEKRLRRRKTESDEALRQRLLRAKMELSFEDRFDATVVNDTLETAVEETVRLVRGFLDDSNPSC